MKEYLALAALLAFGVSVASAQGEGVSPQSAGETSSAEMERLFEEDQADRTPAPGKSIDWEKVGMRDEARERRVKELIHSGALRTGADYFHAAMVLQHASEPDDYLLAHDLCVIAIGKGEHRGKWLAAASLDRFLMAIGRQQRFGTQFISRRSFHPPKLAPVDPNVPDHLRRELNVPSLEEARKREAEMAKEFEDTRRAN
jgi:hypothetical protein